ncbi:MAG: MBL fold metallo-hydrolase [Bacteroidia bacterium]
MKRFTKILKWLAFIILILGGIAFTIYMIYLRPFMQKMKETHLVQYDTELTLMLGGGGNSGILVGDSLVLVIDTKMNDASEQLYKKVKELAGYKHILVVNTHFHPDHTGGNKFYKGQSIMAGGNYSVAEWKNQNGDDGLPTEWLKQSITIAMGTDSVTIYNMGKNIHTASDVVVYLHRRKMLFTGDLVLNKQAPVIMGVADPEAYLEAFDMLPKLFDIQQVVPGHGINGGKEIIDTFRQYFLDMKAAAADDSKKAELTAKYKDWNQIPILMSPGATIDAFKKKMKTPAAN